MKKCPLKKFRGHFSKIPGMTCFANITTVIFVVLKRTASTPKPGNHTDYPGIDNSIEKGTFS